LHEANLHHLVAEVTIRRGDWDAYLQELEYDAGPEAVAHGRKVRAGEAGPDYNGVPMLRRLLERSRALIVHSQYVAGRAREAVAGDDPGAFRDSGSGSTSGALGKGEGTSYATVHVAAAAAMWLRLHGLAIARTYREPWQRVEAFRSLVRATAQAIDGNEPANGSGILNIAALLSTDLPPPDRLRKRPADADKFA
jgi:hypothetical protein